jgi:hypothetical protein
MYPDPVGRPVPSKRWEAWREGLEDYLLLHTYEEELRARGGPQPEEEALLQEARHVGDMGEAPLELMDELADRIVQRLLGWRGETPTKPFPQHHFQGWEYRILGDRQGTVRPVADGRDGDLALEIRNATDQSWTFVVRRVAAKPGQVVTFRLWARGNARLQICVSEGFPFGGDPAGHRISRQDVPLTEQWQEIVIEHEVKEEPVEAAVGLDYGCGEQQAVICQGEVEVK